MRPFQLIAVIGAFWSLSFSTADAADPPVVVNQNICCVVPGNFVTQMLETSQGDSPIIIWSDFSFEHFSPLIGETRRGPFHPATFDAETRLFSWNSRRSPYGIYEWRVTATNQFGSDEGSLFIATILPDEIIPEPGSLTLAPLALMGLGRIVRRRR